MPNIEHLIRRVEDAIEIIDLRKDEFHVAQNLLHKAMDELMEAQAEMFRAWVQEVR